MCREHIELLICCFTYFPALLYFLINIIKEKDKVKRGKYAFGYLIVMTILSCIPFDKIIDILPIQHPTIEKAIKFDYNDDSHTKNELIFKKKYNNTYFVAVRETTSSSYEDRKYTSDIFNCYSKEYNGWRPVLKISQEQKTRTFKEGYEIYFCNNKKDNVTGVFIIVSSSSNFKENVKIEDKYGTKFDYIRDNKNEPIKYSNRDEYIYLGIVDENLNKHNYNLKINGKRIIEN